jgi:hypothetical protein
VGFLILILNALSDAGLVLLQSLLRGETDGSSFPNGGLRATHSAAGYTLWDGITPPFIRDDALFLPSVFYAWTGDALDEKIPLLRATSAMSTQAMRLLRALGDKKTSSVFTSVGCEQEFFLVDRAKFHQRIDLRTVCDVGFFRIFLVVLGVWNMTECALAGRSHGVWHPAHPRSADGGSLLWSHSAAGAQVLLRPEGEVLAHWHPDGDQPQ